MIPEDAHDHYGQDRYEWVVVEIPVDEGELDMEDVWLTSRIETEDRSGAWVPTGSEIVAQLEIATGDEPSLGSEGLPPTRP